MCSDDRQVHIRVGGSAVAKQFTGMANSRVSRGRFGRK
jgi:hypothetical protein